MAGTGCQEETTPLGTRLWYLSGPRRPGPPGGDLGLGGDAEPLADPDPEMPLGSTFLDPQPRAIWRLVRPSATRAAT